MGMQIMIDPLIFFSVYIKPTDHLYLKVVIFSRSAASFKIWISKVQDFVNFYLSPMDAHIIPAWGSTHIFCVILSKLILPITLLAFSCVDIYVGNRQ